MRPGTPRWLLNVLLVCTFLTPAALAQETTEEDLHRSIQQGTRLHDAGDYDGALALYRGLLESHPGNPTLLYEMAFSSLAKGDNEATIQFARQALENHSTSAAACYVLIGSAYDSMGKSKEGESAFREGLKAFPRDQMLHFNLGINLAQQGDLENGEKELQESLLLRPDHPGSWVSLAKVVDKLGWKGRAFLCYERFLTLEPDSKRSQDPAKRLNALLFENIKDESKPGAEKKEITVTIPQAASGKAKDLRSQEALMLSLAGASRYTEEGDKKTDDEFFASAAATLVAMMLESEQVKKSGVFWNELVFAYFQEAQKEGHLEAMAFETRRSLGTPEITGWLAAHSEQVAKFRAWSGTWKPGLDSKN